MVNAIVLIKTQYGHNNKVAEALVDLPEISEVYSVGGSYDLIAILRVNNNDDIATLVTDRMVHVNGIESTETMVSFKTYSKHDLENVFSIGMEDQ